MDPAEREAPRTQRLATHCSAPSCSQGSSLACATPASSLHHMARGLRSMDRENASWVRAVQGEQAAAAAAAEQLQRRSAARPTAVLPARPLPALSAAVPERRYSKTSIGMVVVVW